MLSGLFDGTRRKQILKETAAPRNRPGRKRKNDKNMEIVLVRNGITGICKQPAIMKKDGNTLSPILYFQKSKGATQKEYDSVVNFIKQQLESNLKKDE